MRKVRPKRKGKVRLEKQRKVLKPEKQPRAPKAERPQLPYQPQVVRCPTADSIVFSSYFWARFY
jgi:hypothetical protein